MVTSLLAAFLHGAEVAPASPADTVFAFVGATVVDGRGGLPMPDAVVVVEGNRIRAVGPRGQVAIPRGAHRVDLAGKFLSPGFIDVHAHVTLGPVEFDRTKRPPALVARTDPGGAERHLAMLLAAGITTIRDPGGVAERVVAVRDSVARGELVGPRMVVAGEVIDRVAFEGLTRAVTTPEEIRREVRRQAAIGVDIIKLYSSLEPALVEAGIDEAHRLGLPAIGHVMATTWTEAAGLGLDGIVHILGWSPDLLPESKRPAYRAMMAGSQFMYGWLELVDLDGLEMRRAIDLIAARGVTLDPTLVVFERAVRGDDPAVIRAATLGMASPALRKNWESFFTFNIGWTADDYRRARAAWPRALALTKRLHDRGVLLAAGTDANNPWVVPGESYHRELELLVESGIPPHEVLTLATRNGARMIGLDGETGTVAVGKRADLVVLRQDPTQSIGATRSIEWVMASGRRHLPDRLLAPWRR
ncbi:MAG: amidohydrolase family protein [Gemmatimonadetes bacterium]|nr:amidohydrolase family protein [Gemmatimonadota bacterium]